MLLIWFFQARYFVEEVRDKCGKDIDVSDWEQEFVLDLPEQANGCVLSFFMVIWMLITSQLLADGSRGQAGKIYSLQWFCFIQFYEQFLRM